MKRPSSSAAGRDAHPSLPELRQLLVREGEADPQDAIAQHLSACATCQSSLTQLAADDSWWQETRSMLDGHDEPRWEPDLTAAYAVADGGAATEGVALGTTPAEQVSHLFAEPKHPEMLGRLGRYDIERVIGSGGMGVVVKAHDSELNRPIAIKLLAPHLAHVGAARERFAREGRAAAAVVHEHVVAIYNVETDGKAPFLVMQFVPGRSLQARVDEDGPLAVAEILRIGMQAAAGLEAAHKQGLVHRDVKPANILLENEVERAILTDFGLARTIDDASLTQTGILAGTPDYMAPEQARGEIVDGRSDLFSLGAVLYFMAAGRPPFRASGAMAVLHRVCHTKQTPVWQINRDIPDELSELIDRLLEKKPSRRPATADAVQTQLAGMLSRLQQGRRPRLTDAWRSRRLRRQLLQGLAGGVLVAGVAATTLWLRTSPTPTPTAQQPFAAQTPLATLFPAPDAEALAFLKGGMNFYYDLGAADQALRQFGDAPRYLQSPDQRWWQEAAGLEQSLSQLESQSPFQLFKPEEPRR